MAEVSFETVSNPPAVQEEKTQGTVVTNDYYQCVGGMEGERTQSDIITPRLQVIARTSKLLGEFKLGELVLNKQVGMGRGPVTVAVVHSKKYFVEATDFDDQDTIPRRFNSSEEVRAAGLRPHDKPSFSKNLIGEVAVPAAEMLLWIQMPASVTAEEDQDLFGIELPDGTKGALAIYSAQRTSYSSTYKVVNTVFELSLKAKNIGIWTRKWKMTTTSEEFEGRVWEQARIAPDGSFGPDAQEFLSAFAAQ